MIIGRDYIYIHIDFHEARLIADGVIIGGGAHCATCRSTLDWKHVVRVRAIEMMARELPKDCEYCNMTGTSEDQSIIHQFV